MSPGVQITSDSDLDVVLEEFKVKQARRDSTGPKYTCSISGCNESFKRLDQLDRHEYHHTGIVSTRDPKTLVQFITGYLLL